MFILSFLLNLCLFQMLLFESHNQIIVIDQCIMKKIIENSLSVPKLFKTNKNVENIYVHMPFCKKKCHFCAFPLHAIGLHYQPQLLDRYFYALKEEIVLSKPYVSSNKLNSLYFGGGTPSLHSPKHFASIMEQFSVTQTTEITVEVNPTQMNSIPALMDMGINRISLGVQSFNSQILQKMGRHAPNNSLAFITQGVSKFRPQNMNVDFILNFCTNQQDWSQMISFIEQVLPEHLTIYMLEINEGSKIYSQPQLLSCLPAEQEVINRYIQLCSFLKDIGYQHYQISNFSRGTNHRSIHSSTYWQGNKEYFAYGMGATSLTANLRITRPRKIAKYYHYVQSLKSGSVPFDLLQIEEEISVKQKLSTIILSGIRTAEGIEWSKMAKIDKQGKYINKIKQSLEGISEQRNQIVKNDCINQRIQLISPYGFLLGDQIGYRLIQAMQQ